MKNIEGIDRVTLEHRRQALKDELTTVEQVINYLDGLDNERLVKLADPTPAAPARVRIKGRQVMGRRKAIATVLYTGKLTVKQISDHLVWSETEVKGSLHSMVKNGLAGCDGNFYFLTNAGELMADRWCRSDCE